MPNQDGPPGTTALVAEPRMESAGVELMCLAWRLAEHPELAEHAERVRDIGAWISVSRMTDMDMALTKVVGSLVGTMRRRNLEFREDLPMEPQFVAFLESLPDPLPGQPGHVDQDSLPPIDRRDSFEAEVDMADVRTWTAGDGTPRAVARTCAVRPPNGLAGEAMVFGEGDLSALLQEGKTAVLRLRSAGGALKVQ